MFTAYYHLQLKGKHCGKTPLGCRSLGAGTCLTYYPFDAHYPPTLEMVIHVLKSVLYQFLSPLQILISIDY